MTTKTTTDIGSGAALLRKLLAYGQALDAEIEAKTCRDAEGRFASCGLAAGNSHEGSARRRNAGKRRRQGPQTGVGAVSRKARRKRAGRKNASRRKWLEDLKANKYGREGKELYRSQFKERRELADVIKSERRESRADERSQRRDLAREFKAERKETRRDQSKERARLKRDQAKETDRESRAFDRQDARLDAKYEAVRATARNPASLERQYRERKQELADARAERMQDLSDEHKQARRDLRDSHRSDRELQRLEQQQRSDSLKDDFRSARVDEHLSHREQAFDLHETHRAERAELIREHINERREEREESGEKGYKAEAGDDIPKAELILNAALEATGHTEGWEAGTLSDEERREVLEAVVAEGRAWFRSEAEAMLSDLGAIEGKALFGAAKAKVGAFFAKAKRHIRELFTAGVLAVAGPGPLDQQDAINEETDKQVAAQVEYLDRFQAQLVAEEKPINQAVASRAEMYGVSVWSAALEVQRQAAVVAGKKLQERRVLGPAEEHCDVCPELAKRGWVKIGTLPKLGSTPCLTWCRCHFEFR